MKKDQCNHLQIVMTQVPKAARAQAMQVPCWILEQRKRHSWANGRNPDEVWSFSSRLCPGSVS